MQVQTINLKYDLRLIDLLRALFVQHVDHVLKMMSNFIASFL